MLKRLSVRPATSSRSTRPKVCNGHLGRRIEIRPLCRVLAGERPLAGPRHASCNDRDGRSAERQSLAVSGRSACGSFRPKPAVSNSGSDGSAGACFGRFHRHRSEDARRLAYLSALAGKQGDRCILYDNAPVLATRNYPVCAGEAVTPTVEPIPKLKWVHNAATIL